MCFIVNLLFGVAAGFLASIFIIISNKSDIRNLQNKNKILSNELNDLRNVAIDEDYETVEGRGLLRLDLVYIPILIIIALVASFLSYYYFKKPF